MASIYVNSSSLTNDPDYVAFNSTFNKLEATSAQVDTLETGITQAEPEQGLFGVLNSLISTAWNSLKLIYSSFGFMTTAYEGLSTVFGVPVWIPLIIGAVVIVIITFQIWGAIFQR